MPTDEWDKVNGAYEISVYIGSYIGNLMAG